MAKLWEFNRKNIPASKFAGSEKKAYPILDTDLQSNR